MLILSLDSASGGCSVCVWHDGTVLASGEEHMERGQDQRLIPLILETMKKANVAFDALDRIAVTRGPGSFTGLRIGLAAARGLGLACGKPVIGIDRFSIFRAQIAEQKKVLVVIQSKRKELFCGFYPAGGNAYESSMMTPEEIQIFLKDKPGTIVTGDIDFTPPPLTPPSRGGESNPPHDKASSPPLEGEVRWGSVTFGTEAEYRKPLEKETITAATLAANAQANDPAFLPRPLYLRDADVTLKAS